VVLPSKQNKNHFFVFVLWHQIMDGFGHRFCQIFVAVTG